MTEKEMYQKYIRPFLISTGCFFQRVEQLKMPDVYTCKNGHVIWIELKVILSVLPVPSWRPGQYAWARMHKEKGGVEVLICMWWKDKIYFVPAKSYYTPEEVEELKRSEIHGKRLFVQ